jgi:hypothetical protein
LGSSALIALETYKAAQELAKLPTIPWGQKAPEGLPPLEEYIGANAEEAAKMKEEAQRKIDEAAKAPRIFSPLGGTPMPADAKPGVHLLDEAPAAVPPAPQQSPAFKTPAQMQREQWKGKALRLAGGDWDTSHYGAWADIMGGPMSTNIEDRRGEADERSKLLFDNTAELKRLNDWLEGMTGGPGVAAMPRYGLTGAAGGGVPGGAGEAGGAPGGEGAPGAPAPGGAPGSPGGGFGSVVRRMFGGGGTGIGPGVPPVPSGISHAPGLTGPLGSPSIPGTLKPGPMAEPGDYSADKSGRGGALYQKLLAEFQKNPPKGGPPDAAQFGITKGTPEEWARFGVSVAHAESGFDPNAKGSAGDPGGSHGIFQYSHGQAYGNAWSVDNSVRAFVRDANASTGGLRRGILGRRFSTIGSHPERGAAYLTQAGKIAVGGGAGATGGWGGEGRAPVANYFEKIGAAPITSGSDPRLTTIGVGSQSWKVNREAAPYLQGFLSELQEKGAPHLTSSGGWNYRLKRGGSTLSEHAYGGAIDVAETGFGGTIDRPTREIPADFARWVQQHRDEFEAAEKRWHIYGGERFGDLGHFEYGGGGTLGREALNRKALSPVTHKVEGSASIDVNVSAPPGTSVTGKSAGLFKPIAMTRQTQMAHAAQGPHVAGGAEFNAA